MSEAPAFLAVDWGTTRMRATLVGADGAVLERAESERGVQSVPPGGFPEALRVVAGPWLARTPGLPVVMAGMVGSRNGWREAPYVPCPCGPAEIAAALMAVTGEAAGNGEAVVARIVPGVDIRWPDGSYDVMRGEEVQALGAGLDTGLVCLPGTHSKWIEMREGRIQHFATFITGELYAAITQSFVGRLAEEPEDREAGVAAGASAATLPGGLGRLLFQARARVLGGDLPPRAVKPFLSGLIVGQEIVGAESLFGAPTAVHLVAASPQREVYRDALESRGVAVTVVDPAEASLRGIARVLGH